MINAENLDFVLTRCGCKTRKAEPCKLAKPPYHTCILIGEPVLTNFLMQHQPEESRRVSRAEALELLEEFHAQGLVHNAWFKDCIKDRFYVICNCCPCCCLGFEMMNMGIDQLAPSGYMARVDAAACQGCQTAIQWCPFDAIEMHDGKSGVIRDRCMGCGICVSKCPHGARSLHLDEGKGLPLDVRKLTAGSC